MVADHQSIWPPASGGFKPIAYQTSPAAILESVSRLAGGLSEYCRDMVLPSGMAVTNADKRGFHCTVTGKVVSPENSQFLFIFAVSQDAMSITVALQ